VTEAVRVNKAMTVTEYATERTSPTRLATRLKGRAMVLVGGVVTDPHKVAAIAEWAAGRSVESGVCHDCG
jgi:hypothetical protein